MSKHLQLYSFGYCLVPREEFNEGSDVVRGHVIAKTRQQAIWKLEAHESIDASQIVEWSWIENRGKSKNPLPTGTIE